MADLTLIAARSPFLITDAVFPPLGIMYLSAFLKHHGFDVQVLDFGLGDDVSMIESNVVGVSFTSPQREEGLKLISELRDLGKIVLVGGPHATHCSDDCISAGADKVFSGYAEESLLSFFVNRPVEVLSHVDKYPYPDRDFRDMHDYKYEINGIPATTLMTSRGCPYSCSFCAKISNKFYQQTASRTVNEIEYIFDHYGFKAFMIFDDVFVANRTRLSQIVDLLLDSPFIFRCFARANLISDEICQLMRKLKIVEVGIGVESGSNEILSINLKQTSRTANLHAFKTLRKYGIRRKAFLIVGLPGESEKTIQETISWIEEAEPDDIDVSVFQPLPGSDIYQNPNKYGIKITSDQLSWYKGTPGKYFASARTKELSEEEIIKWRDEIENRFKDKNKLK